MSTQENIAVIGSGLMGHGIAQIFSVNGHSVALMDLREELLDKAIEGIRSNLTLMAQNGIGSQQDIEPAIRRIKTTTNIEEATAGVDFVFEAVLEKLELKQKVFQDLDLLCPPETILASNTSVISITEIGQNTSHSARVVGTHFWNPPYLIPLVEVVRGDETDNNTVDRTYELLQRVGKHPVRVKKDVPGFVGNRLQHALWREALSIVENGIAEAATVDECIKYGFGLRLPHLGPLENVDMVGTDLTLAVHEYLLKHLEKSPQPSALLKKMVAEGKLGFKSGQGYRKWSPDAVQNSRDQLVKYLLKVTINQGLS